MTFLEIFWGTKYRKVAEDTVTASLKCQESLEKLSETKPQPSQRPTHESPEKKKKKVIRGPRTRAFKTTRWRVSGLLLLDWPEGSMRFC